MALIRCIECGKEISDKSDSCPNCGCPTIESLKQIEREQYKDNLVYKCPICGVDHASGVLKCPVCGYSKVKTPSMEAEERKERLEREANIPKCPTCGSTKIKKVSATSKAVSVGLFGLFSQKVKKTWHCNSCGYEW